VLSEKHNHESDRDLVISKGELLIVEDDPISCRVWADCLASAGYNIYTAYSADTAVKALNAKSFDLVISDQRLGEHSALALLRHLRETNVRTRFVIVTGFACVEDAVEAMKLGAIDYLQKPVDLDLLLNVVSTCLTPCELVDRISATSSYAASRWAAAVANLMSANRDVRTIEDWGREVGASSGTIRNWCRTAQVSARRSLLLGRLLRAVLASSRTGWHPEQLLDIVDNRTLDKILTLGRLPKTARHIPIDDFINRQCLISDRNAVQALRRAVSTRARSRDKGER
jgi:ActR/RegA family two-component response regulator